MPLSDDLTAEASKPSRRSCGVRTLLSQLEPDDFDAVVTALADPRMTGTAIQRALTKNGHDIGIATIQRHRREACACEGLV